MSGKSAAAGFEDFAEGLLEAVCARERFETPASASESAAAESKRNVCGHLKSIIFTNHYSSGLDAGTATSVVRRQNCVADIRLPAGGSNRISSAKKRHCEAYLYGCGNDDIKNV